MERAAEATVLDAVVIGAGQAGLSAAHHLLRRGLAPGTGVVVLDANARPGGAWQHRWDTLTLHDVHGIADLPGATMPAYAPSARADTAVPAYFSAYERDGGLPVERPVRVGSVEPADDGLLAVISDGRRRLTRTLVNATGTWDRPFWPRYPGADDFRGTQLHTADYRGPLAYAGRHVLVVGGGASAVQLLAEIQPHARTTWVTRRPPVWRTGDFTPEDGRAAVALVEERVRQGLPPGSVVSVTGLALREQEQAAAAAGAYERRPMFARILPGGVAWDDGSTLDVDVILWATGFRPSVAHLAPLRLREPGGGIRLEGTTAVRDDRVQLVGYGPSASTIGANRAGRAAADAVVRRLRAGPE